MGQLQKRFEDQHQAQFQEAPEGVLSWQPKQSPPLHPKEISPTSQTVVTSIPRWQINVLQIGGIVIVVLLLILIFG